MSDKLHLSSEALLTIDEQMVWFEEQLEGDELADRWLDLLMPALEKVSQKPERNGYAPENGRWRPEIIIRQKRFRPWKNKPGWRILYTSDESEQTTTILQIRHEKRPLLEPG